MVLEKNRAQLLTKRLNCKVINLPGNGNFITQDMGSDEFPELINKVLK